MRAAHDAMTNIHGRARRNSLDTQQSAPYIHANLNMARALATRPDDVTAEMAAVSLVGALLLVLLLLVLIRPLGGSAG